MSVSDFLGVACLTGLLPLARLVFGQYAHEPPILCKKSFLIMEVVVVAVAVAVAAAAVAVAVAVGVVVAAAGDGKVWAGLRTCG